MGDYKGWLEAAVAWEVCASIHRKFAKNKDPFFSTRQRDFIQAAYKAREIHAAAPTTPVAAENTSQERVLNQAGNEHEPVATVYYPATGGNAGIAWTILKADGVMPPAGAKLYLRPPPLHMPEPMTDAEIVDAFCETPGIYQFIEAFRAGVRFAERRVKEANK